MGRLATFTPSHQEARACSVGSSPANAGFGEGGRDPGSPWQRCARPRLPVPRDCAPISPFLSSGDLQEARCCLREGGARDWRGWGSVSGPTARSATSVTDGSDASLCPFKSVQESRSAPLEMIYTPIRTTPNQIPSPFRREGSEVTRLPLLPLRPIETFWVLTTLEMAQETLL